MGHLAPGNAHGRLERGHAQSGARLLGSGVGVQGAFEGLGRKKVAGAAQLAPERVMGTIAEALVATAIGLLVAIPAVAVFNYFQGLMTSALENADTLGHVLLTHMVARQVDATLAGQGT